MLANLCSKSFKLGFSNVRTKNFQIHKLGLEKQRNIHWTIGKATESRKTPISASLIMKILYVDENKYENSKRDENIRLPYLSPEKPICKSRSNI